ncbi:PhzF family isomerase [Rhodanobacter sp. Col0626]|uniref:PhzF family isomerase n=1 Tax=Rhodanobacter sp. Col0626 TaxID=3415679 RepID=UPI003CE830F4
MDNTYRIYQIDAFTKTRFTGNPAGVVPEAAGLDEAQMQAIARELNNSETAFILPPRGPGHDLHVRFFTPTTEVPVCGHATIASHYVRAIEGTHVQGRVHQLTGAGVLAVDVEPMAPGDFRIWMHQREPTFGAVLAGGHRQALLAALRLSDDDLGPGPIQIVSTGHSKVMVPLRDRVLLDALAPDLGALSALSRVIGCNGYHAFTLADPAPDTLAHARMFAPAIGIAEDPVTGNANGPLGAYLVLHRLVPPALFHAGLVGWISQGEAIGRPGRVKVEVSVDPANGQPTHVRIAGDAVVAFRGEIKL